MAKWGKCNYRQLKELQRKIERLSSADTDRFCRDMAKDIAARLLRKTKKRTPVDTGNLRRGWTVSEVRKNGSTYEIEIFNPAEYASYVEYGHRTANHKGWVKGRFMLTISEQEINAMAPALIEKKLYAYLAKELNSK